MDIEEPQQDFIGEDGELDEGLDAGKRIPTIGQFKN